MKLTSLLISILVFLMSGVVCLLSIQDVYAQVPQTKRSEQDSFLKNIRAKKRNNDLQKARRAKGRSNQKKSNKFRFRSLTYYEKPDEDGEEDGYAYERIGGARYFSVEFIYNNIGISKSYYGKYFEKKYPERQTNNWGERYRLDSINISYLFGDEFTLAFGTSVYLFKGYAEKWNWNDDGSKFVHSSENVSGNISFIALGLQIGFLEFVLDLRNVGDVKFEDFKCSQGNCGNSKKYEEEPITLSTTLNFGLGFVF